MAKLKKPIIKNLFNKTASKYDFLNDILSLGLHRIWKRKLIHLADPSPGENWLDLCCGTGDLTFNLARKVKPGGKVLGLDFAEKPLLIANQRLKNQASLEISWLKIDITNTKLNAKSYDGAVMSYGLRNLNNPLEALIEINRILKPRSKVAILDFNRLEDGSIGKIFQEFYLKKIVVPIAQIFNLKAEYKYIEESIKTFPNGRDQEALAIKAGFSEACHQSIASGQMGILLLRSNY